MAYRRNITARTRLFAQQRFTPSISYVNHEEEDQHSEKNVKVFGQSRSYGVLGGKSNTRLGYGVSFGDRRRFGFIHEQPMTASAFLVARNMSTTIGDGEKIKCVTNMADVMADKTMEVVSTQEAVSSEVAVAAADSWLPVAALQYVIDGIHIFTGLNWWASIAIATLVIRTLSIPILINQLKTTSKLNISTQKVQELTRKLRDKHISEAEFEEQKIRACKENVVNVFSSFKGIFIQGPVFASFFLAIQNMVEKVPSFKTGGVSWFHDLTTADPFYLLPCLTAFTFWLTLECNMSNPSKLKYVSRAFAALTVPLTTGLPKAVFCYWITSNLFSLLYGHIITKPAVKKLLNIPVIIPSPPSPARQSKLPLFFEGLKKYASAQATQPRQAEKTNQTTTNQSVESPHTSKDASSKVQKSTNQSVSSSASILSHRTKILYKKIKRRRHKRK